MKKIKFSVLMSVYKKEKPEYLKQALDSIINQTLQPNEIVLVEDGTLTDELEIIVKKYEKKYSYFKVIRFKKNRGLGPALNDGLKECKYEYIARMDSDDISLPDRFEKQINYIIKHSYIDVVGGNITEFDDITNYDISERIVPQNKIEIEKYIKRRNPMNHVTVMFNKKSVESVGGYIYCPYFEDYYLWSRMIKSNYNLANIDDILVRVRAGLSMISRRGNFYYIRCIINFEKKLLEQKIINILTFFNNVMIRIIISLMPNKVRYYIYQKKLRQCKENNYE